jgi:hypothetical protein
LSKWGKTRKKKLLPKCVTEWQNLSVNILPNNQGDSVKHLPKQFGISVTFTESWGVWLPKVESNPDVDHSAIM